MVAQSLLKSLENPLKVLFPCAILWGIIHSPAHALNINRISSTNAGAEIATYDPISQQIFVTTKTTSVDYFNISDPSNPGAISTIDLTPYGAEVQSVAVKNGILAVAVQAAVITDPGSVVFFDTNGNFQSQVTVGALPDMLTFTPDGNRVLVANEGEPSGGVNPEGSVSIINISGGILSPSVTTANFNAFNGQENTLRNLGVRIQPGVSASQDFEPEYITVSSDSQKAWVALQENNTIAVLNLITQEIESLQPLGTKNHNTPENALDPSDRDGGININPWPVLGMYMPDGIATYEKDGQIYLLTANEGDSRTEDVRINSITLDPMVFPNAATLQQNANLGRLLISSWNGQNANGQYTQLFAYGARSFSIWNTSNFSQVYDSGDDFEQLTANLVPSIFNSDGDPASFDTRSDNKGPEPEGIAVGSIGNRFYSFTGLERTGGVMIYDITDTNNATFANYINDNNLGDRSPEGILFISAEDSPNGKPLLVVSNEASLNVVIYSVTTPESSSIISFFVVGMMGFLLKKRHFS
jgi:DNA-binding beta-propeller fold protein YncE